MGHRGAPPPPPATTREQLSLALCTHLAWQMAGVGGQCQRMAEFATNAPNHKFWGQAMDGDKTETNSNTDRRR